MAGTTDYDPFSPIRVRFISCLSLIGWALSVGIHALFAPVDRLIRWAWDIAFPYAEAFRTPVPRGTETIIVLSRERVAAFDRRRAERLPNRDVSCGVGMRLAA